MGTLLGRAGHSCTRWPAPVGLEGLGRMMLSYQGPGKLWGSSAVMIAQEEERQPCNPERLRFVPGSIYNLAISPNSDILSL